MEHKGYKAKAFFDESIDAFSGHVVNLKRDVISFEGQSVAELKENFIAAVDDYLEACATFGDAPEVPDSDFEREDEEKLRSRDSFISFILGGLKEHLTANRISYTDFGELLGRGRAHISRLLSDQTNMTLKTYHDLWFTLGARPSIELESYLSYASRQEPQRSMVLSSFTTEPDTVMNNIHYTYASKDDRSDWVADVDLGIEDPQEGMMAA